MQGFSVKIAKKYMRLQKRGFPLAEEHWPLMGQAALWYDEMKACMPPSAILVGRQLARLCRDDSQVTIPFRSLADAVGHKDSAGRHIAYTQQGVEALEKHRWVFVDTVGRGRGAKTSYYLTVGDRGRVTKGDESEVLEEGRLDDGPNNVQK